MPRILITSQVYPPEIHPSAVMVRELATHLAKNGWDVDVFCGYPHHPTGVLPDGWTKSLWRRADEDGFTVLRTWHVTSPRRAIPVRASVYVSQALGTAAGAWLSEKPDLVLVYGPPLVGACLGALVAYRHGAKLANVVYDIYPDIAIETKKVTNPLVIGAARVAERFQYQTADLTIVLSDGFKRQLIGKGVSEEKIAVVPVWLDPDEVKPMDRDNAWRREHGIGLDKFVVLYAGTIGIISGATIVAESADLLRARKDIVFVFVGEGEEKSAVQSRARELQLDNMVFFPFQPRERLAEVQATADVGLVTLVPGRGRTSVPSKVQGYMAAGRPVIASVDADSDTASLTKDGNIGLVVEPANAASLAAAVVELADHDDMRHEMGTRSRNVLLERFAKTRVLDAFHRALLRTVAGRL